MDDASHQSFERRNGRSVWMIMSYVSVELKFSNIRGTKSPNFNISRLDLQLPLHNILKPSAKWIMKM